jgi:hypothetical protein
MPEHAWENEFLFVPWLLKSLLLLIFVLLRQAAYLGTYLTMQADRTPAHYLIDPELLSQSTLPDLRGGFGTSATI